MAGSLSGADALIFGAPRKAILSGKHGYMLGPPAAHGPGQSAGKSTGSIQKTRMTPQRLHAGFLLVEE